jgi:hypothetical protein
MTWGRKTGGKKKGTKNKATIAREEQARAQIAASLSKARSAGNVTPRIALDEMYKAVSIAEGLAGLLQPNVTKTPDGTLTIQGGDVKLFGEWFERYCNLIKELAKYQIPQVKPVEAPTPPPDPRDLEQKARKRFGLRIFEGGRPPAQVVPLPVNGKAPS